MSGLTTYQPLIVGGRLSLGAIDLVRTQPGGRGGGGQSIVINFITVQGGGGVKKAQKLRAY